MGYLQSYEKGQLEAHGLMDLGVLYAQTGSTTKARKHFETILRGRSADDPFAVRVYEVASRVNSKLRPGTTHVDLVQADPRKSRKLR